MYKQLPNGAVLRLADNAHIPADPLNTDYAGYLKYVEGGGTTEPLDLPNPNLAILAQIDAIEAATGGQRWVREGLMAFAEDKAERIAAAMTAQGTPTTADALLSQNPAYVKAKAFDAQIRALRSQLK